VPGLRKVGKIGNFDVYSDPYAKDVLAHPKLDWVILPEDKAEATFQRMQKHLNEEISKAHRVKI